MPYIQKLEKERYPDSYRDKNFQFFFAALQLSAPIAIVGCVQKNFFYNELL